MPVELKLLMWLPAMPTKAEPILQSAISSASSSARWIAETVASMFTTTPFFRPRDSWLPMPRISSVASGRSSATRHATFEVPISSATMRSLFSLAMSLRFPSSRELRHAQREPVRVPQVDVLVRSLDCFQSDRVNLHEPAQALLCEIGVAAQHQGEPVGEAQLPGIARGEHHPLHRYFQGRHGGAEACVAARHLMPGPRWREKQRQGILRLRPEDFAVRAHQGILAP